MPPKFKFTREQIIFAGLNVVRRNGMEGLTARGLAAELGSSAKPVFGLFQNMEEVQREVMCSANALYQSYLEQELEQKLYPPYKATGMAYIRFAKEEKELFKLLFMRDRSKETIGDNREEIRPVLEIIMESLKLDEEQALKFHLEMWIYVHGIATMLATSYLDWDMEQISNLVTDAYMGLKSRL